MDEVILFTSDLGTGAVDVDGEQNSVILMKDTMIADLTAQLSALRTENEEMVVAHSAQNLEHERRQASLGDTINILQGQRSNMMINLGGLSEDKERLEADVEKLNQEVMRLQTMIPVPNEEAPTPEPTPEPTPVRLGFVARVKKGIEVVLNSEVGSKLVCGCGYIHSLWNSLPIQTRYSNNVPAFKRVLETHLVPLFLVDIVFVLSCFPSFYRYSALFHLELYNSFYYSIRGLI